MCVCIELSEHWCKCVAAAATTQLGAYIDDYNYDYPYLPSPSGLPPNPFLIIAKQAITGKHTYIQTDRLREGRTHEHTSSTGDGTANSRN